ncbi:MAG: hypothetical protein H7095_08790 [Pseudopedobacter sp.]|nr:hypothetical protein [Deinococcales bacterium]
MGFIAHNTAPICLCSEDKDPMKVQGIVKPYKPFLTRSSAFQPHPLPTET